MYYCNDCNNEFEEPVNRKTTYEREYGVSDLFQTQHEYLVTECPVCGSDDIEEMKICDCCGEWVPDDFIHDTTEMINGGVGWCCEQCIEDADMKEL